MTELCPRCEVNYYTPYGEDWDPGDPSPPSLSRVDNETYICAQCGQDEAIRDWAKEPLAPPQEWPVT